MDSSDAKKVLRASELPFQGTSVDLQVNGVCRAIVFGGKKMSMSVRRSLFGALLGLVVATAVEAVRFGLGEHRSMGEMLFMIIGFTAFGSIAPLFRSSKGDSRSTFQTETNQKQNTKEDNNEA